MKRAIIVALIFSLVLSSIGCTKLDLDNNTQSNYEETITDNNLPVFNLEIGEVLDGMDLSTYDLGNNEEIIFKVDFDTETIFPSNDNLPGDFNPEEIIRWGKEPGLNIKNLHDKGITGRGVNIAYVDQPLLINHEEYVDKSIHYEKIREKGNEAAFNSSMHGPAVTSILIGENLGVAPDINLYYLANPAWLGDQATHAESIYRIMEINETLPENEKIRIIGFSDARDSSEKNLEAFQKAYDEATASGIMMFTVEDGFMSAQIEPYMNRNDYRNYKPADWIGDAWLNNNSLKSKYILVPSTFTLAGYRNSDSYGYDYQGGLSWTVPYVVGLSALGLQIDPSLNKQEILDYLSKSAYKHDGFKIINPEGFIELILTNGDKYMSLEDILKETKDIKSINNLKDIIEEKKQSKESFFTSIPIVKSNDKELFSYVDDGYTYADMEYSTYFNNEEIQLESVGVAYEDDYINIKIKTILPEECILTIFLQGDLPGFKEHSEGLIEGSNTIIIKLEKEKLLNFEVGLGITIGEGNFIFIEKDLLDKIALNNLDNITQDNRSFPEI